MCTHTCACVHRYSRHCVVTHVYCLIISEVEARKIVLIQGQSGQQSDFKAKLHCREILSPTAENKTRKELIEVSLCFLRWGCDRCWIQSHWQKQWRPILSCLIKMISACKWSIKCVFVLMSRSILLCWFPVSDFKSVSRVSERIATVFSRLSPGAWQPHRFQHCMDPST